MKRTKCPYIPTCSQYGLEAIEKYGALRVVFLRYGGYFAVILFPTEAMTLYRKDRNVLEN